MKKTIAFRQPTFRPQPAKDVDNWVKGASSTNKLPIRPIPPEGKLARLTIDLPPDLHARFKAICAMQKTRMIDEVRGFIEEWTQKHS